MALTTVEQIKQLCTEKKRILITFRKDGNGDSIGSAAALALFLEKQGKKVDIVSDGFALPHGYKFIKKAREIKPSFGHLQKFIVSIDVAGIGVDELTYDIEAEKLRIFITPRQGFLTRDRVRTAQSEFLYDLIIVLDTPDIASLGQIYENNTELFFKTTIINIDYRAQNEHFGQVNLVDLTAGATSEIIYSLLLQLGKEYVDDAIATAILTGIIAQTRSFKNDSTKPHTLTVASALIELGANRDEIVTQLFRTRSIGTLKLWGQALRHLGIDSTIGLVWSTITREDFARSGADEESLSDIIDELITNSREAKMTLLLHEHQSDKEIKIHGILSAEPPLNAKQLVAPFSPTGTASRASFVIAGKTLKQAEENVIEQIRKSDARGKRQ